MRVVFVDEKGVRLGSLGRERPDPPLKTREVLQHPRILNRFRRVVSPRERSVIGDEHGLHFRGRDGSGAKGLSNHQTCVFLVAMSEGEKHGRHGQQDGEECARDHRAFHFITPKMNTVCDRYSAPGRKVVVGNFG